MVENDAPAATRRAVLASGLGVCGLAVTSSTTAGRPLTDGGSAVLETACEDWAQLAVGGGDMALLNNVWGNSAAEQCILRYDDGSYGWRFAGGDGEVNYPEVFCGGRPWGEDTGVAAFPIDRDDVAELVMTYELDVAVEEGAWNLAEEWWLVDGDTGPDPDIAHEVMLVCDWGGGHAEDHGDPVDSGAVTDGFGNRIDYWARYRPEHTFHIFRLADPAQAGRIDLTAIIEYLTAERGIGGDLTLTGIELGTETFDGPTGSARVDTFAVSVNGSLYVSGSDRGLRPPRALATELSGERARRLLRDPFSWLGL